MIILIDMNKKSRINTNRLPNLNYIIFSRTCNHPRKMWIPTEVRYLVCMSTMYKLKLKRGLYQNESLWKWHEGFSKKKLTSNSGGPSSASSAVCSDPILLKSQIIIRRSPPADARIVSSVGDHPSWMISPWWCPNVCSLIFRLRKSHKLTV